MNPNPESEPKPQPLPGRDRTTFYYDAGRRTSAVCPTCGNVGPLLVSGEAVPTPEPAWRAEHDREDGTFVLTGPDGKVERFRDRPRRFLVLEKDPETGEMTPVISGGRLRILSLCGSINGQ